jgi:UDP-2,3-diacylglucosamine hydrolase
MGSWVLADAHGGASREADLALLSMLEAAIRAKQDLLILGDLFAAWIGLDRDLTNYQAEVIEALRKLRRSGSCLRFMVGNRDYLVREGQLGRTFDEVYEQDVLLPLGGVPTWISHGDLARHDDRAYRVWRAVSRSRPSTRLLQGLPGAIARPLAIQVERALRGTNRSYKSGDLPFDAIAELGRRGREAGARRAVVGHFHQDRVVDVAAGVPVVIAPAWLEHRRVLEVREDGRLRSIDPLAPSD